MYKVIMRNVEIKAVLRDSAAVISKAKELSNADCQIIKQHDTFFKTREGRLKLRQFPDGSGELIYYKRTDMLGPKLCNFEKTSLNPDACVGIKNILTESNGCIGIVKKTRQLYMVGQTRVHIDEVEGLGDYMELEVVLNDKQDVATGEEIAEKLMTALGIESKDLVPDAYVDLLSKSRSPS